MSSSIFRTALRCMSEGGLFALAAFEASTLIASSIAEATLIVFLASITVAFALRSMLLRGSFRLAWRFPRVEALGLRIPRTEEAWSAVDAAEAILSALEGDARSFREFFPTAREDVRLALERALEADVTTDEVQGITASLRAIALRLRNSSAPLSASVAREALDGLAARSRALAEAVDELATGPNVIRFREGDRS